MSNWKLYIYGMLSGATLLDGSDLGTKNAEQAIETIKTTYVKYYDSPFLYRLIIRQTTEMEISKCDT